MTSIVEVLCEAIRTMRLVRFRYQTDDTPRVVEPYLVGESVAGHEVLFAWYLPTEAGKKAPGWRTYLLDDLRTLEVLDVTFSQPRDGFNLNDRNIVSIRCSISAMRILTEEE